MKAGGSVVSPPPMVTSRKAKRQKRNKQQAPLKASQVEQQKKDESTIISDEPSSLVVEDDKKKQMDIDDNEEDSKASQELAPEVQKPKILAAAAKTNDLSIKEHDDLKKGSEESHNDESEVEKSIKEMNAKLAPEGALKQAPEDAPTQVPEAAPRQAPEDTPKQAPKDALKQGELTSPEKQKKSINPTGSKRLFVGNLDFKISEAQVAEFFKLKVHASDILKVDLSETRDGKAKGYGYVEFATQEAVQKALELQNQMLCNRSVKLEFARVSGVGGKDDGRGDSRTMYDSVAGGKGRRHSSRGGRGGSFDGVGRGGFSNGGRIGSGCCDGPEDFGNGGHIGGGHGWS